MADVLGAVAISFVASSATRPASVPAGHREMGSGDGCPWLQAASAAGSVAGKDLESAVYATEELEETAKLYLMFRGNRLNILTQDQVAELHRKWPQ